MAKRRSAAQIQSALKAVTRDVAKGLTVADSCRRHGITEQSYYRWRRRHDASSDDAGVQLREAISELKRLKELVADVMLENQMLREVAQKKW